MSIRLGNNIVAGRSPYQPSLFDFKWADHVLTDPQWVRADTNLWHNRSVFTPAYDHLLADIQGKEAQSETIEGVIITYYLASDGHKICLSDQAGYLNALYEKTGVAWYYMIDTTTQSFKVPRSKWNVVGIRDEVGKYVKPGLPNIVGWSNGEINFLHNSSNSYSGALYSSNDYTYEVLNSQTTQHNQSRQLNFDASRSNPIYGSSSVVQSTATQMYLYFYIGNFTQTALENTAGANLSDIEEVMDEAVDNITGLLNTKVTVGHEVVAFQAPTSENNYTWYRKYASGWVEQGGYIAQQSSSGLQSVVLPITMRDEFYNFSATTIYSANAGTDHQEATNELSAKTTTGFTKYIWTKWTQFVWKIEGMAAS